MKNYLIKLLLIVVLATIGATILYAATTWSGAPNNPPTQANIFAPINASSTDQTKQGDVCTMKGGVKKCLSTAKMRLPVINSFAVSPTTVSSGGSATLSWSSTEASSCTASGSWSGSKATSSSGVSTGSLSGGANYTFTLVCSGPLGDSISKSVSVYSYPPPSITSFYPTLPSVYTGQSTNVNWTSSGTSYCWGYSPNPQSPWFGSWHNIATSGSESTGIFSSAGTTLYYVLCNSNLYSNPYPLYVTAITPPVPTVTITASKSTAISGVPANGTPDYVDLTWSSTDVSSCVTSGWDSTFDANYGTLNGVYTPGISTYGPPVTIGTYGTIRLLSKTPQNVTYNITCTGVTGSSPSSVSSSVTVNWQAPTPNPSIFDVPGAYTFKVPTGVTSLQISAWSGGGGGGSNSSTVNYDSTASMSTGGGGGGSGGYQKRNLIVSPGDIFNITVGAGGAGGIISTALTVGKVGGSTKITRSFDNSVVVDVSGGAGGRNYNWQCNGGQCNGLGYCVVWPVIAISYRAPGGGSGLGVVVGNSGVGCVNSGGGQAGGAPIITTSGIGSNDSAGAGGSQGRKGGDGKVVIWW